MHAPAAAPVVPHQPPHTTARGLACGVGAGALWGLVFLAPQLVRDFAPLQLAIGRYLAYGLLAAALIGPRWRSLAARVTWRDWRALAWLSLMGNTLYYILLAAAIQLGGIALTSLVIGFLPVAVTIIGTRDAGALPLRRLALPLLLCAAGALCIGWETFAPSAAGGSAGHAAGLGCAVGALACWTAYAVGNSRCLVRLNQISAHDWSLLIGITTGAQALLLIPASLCLDRFAHPAPAWLAFASVSCGVAILASIIGNALWNRMSRLLPLTLVGQMILFETLFALLYGLLWEQRLPSIAETAAAVFVTLGVVTCIAAHRPQPA